MFGVSIFAIAFIIIAGLSLYNKLLGISWQMLRRPAILQCAKKSFEFVQTMLSHFILT